MAQEIDTNLLTMWLNAEHLPVPVIRALIDEVNAHRARRRSNHMVTFIGPEPGPLDYPLLEIMRNGRVFR
jgi:hypothetical protein